VTSHGLSLEELAATLPAGGAAYIDRDWLADGAAPTVASAVVFAPEAGLRWAGGAGYPAGDDPDAAAWGMLDALAARTADAASAAAGTSGSVLVPGGGLLAQRVRARLRAQHGAAGESPAVVVDTTGSAEGLRAACAAVADLGAVVLAVTPLGGTVAYDLYVEVHRRGLRLIGVPDPTEPDWAGPDADIPAPITLRPGVATGVRASAWLVLRA
jgi:hypothetical protein